MHFLACKDVAGGSHQSGGKRFFHEIRWPVRWVPALRWRNNYFARNKEALPCCGCRPSCQPLHVQYSSDGSRSLTMLTMPLREHHSVHGRGASPLSASHVQSSFDDSRLLTMLTTPCRAHQGRWTTARPRLEQLGDGEDGAVESQMERSGKLDWFWCTAAQPWCRPQEIGARTEVEEGARLLDNIQRSSYQNHLLIKLTKACVHVR